MARSLWLPILGVDEVHVVDIGYLVYNMSKGVFSKVGSFPGKVLGKILELPDPRVNYRPEMII